MAMQKEAGVGISINKGPFTVADLAPNGPASKTGQIRVGDLLVMVDNQGLQGLNVDQVGAEHCPPRKPDTYSMQAETSCESAPLDGTMV